MEDNKVRIGFCEHTQNKVVQEKFVDEWICIHEDTREQELATIKKLFDTYYVLWDKANDTLVAFDNGEVVIYGDKEEAEINCRGNEYVTKCTDLPEHHKEKLIKQQLNN